MHMILKTGLIWAVLLVSLASTPASACGENTKCRIGDRHYFIALPQGHDGRTPLPVIVFAHGYQGSGLGIIQNPRLRAVANQLGAAFVAVKSRGESWSLINAPDGSPLRQSEELAYFDDVLADLKRRFPIDPTRVVMTGASTGGMMTWTLACHRSAAFAAFIPMSGTFWRPIPDRCTGPTANIVHFHGTRDRTVPLEGRPVAGTHQGSVHAALAMYRNHGKFRRPKSRAYPGLQCKISRNRQGNILNFCLYDGGHSFRASNLSAAWYMLLDAGQL